MDAISLHHCSEVDLVVVVPNFKDLVEQMDKDEYITVEFLHVGDVKFALLVYPKGHATSPDGYIALGVSVHAVSALRVWVGFSIVDGRDRMLSVRRKLAFDSPCTIGSMFEANALEAEGYISDGILRVRVQLKYVGKDSPDRPDPPSMLYRRLPPHIENLTSDLRKLHDARDGDVVLVVNGKEYCAHKNILRVRSPVFYAMLGTSMVEGSSGRVEIKDLDSRAFEGLLAFIYTAELPSKASSGQDDAIDYFGSLMQAADRYGMAELLDLCVKNLERLMGTLTVLRMLTIANELQIQELKTACLKYATRNQNTLRELLDQPAFDELNPDLVRELFIMDKGSGKRRIADGIEFPDGSDWARLSNAQLKRAMDERGLSSTGDKSQMFAQLEAASKDTPPST